ncbi:MAG: hypothetical protein QM230_01665 [Chloroflexota bacterium]|jgi:hypothetical protein|nr:hypothetical protein [Chloroflexota bacterium]
MLYGSQHKRKIGIVGGAASGKSTMLMALRPYINLFAIPGKHYRLVPDDPTLEKLDQLHERLEAQSFPDATQLGVVNNFIFDLTDGNQTLHVETQDRPGGDYTSVPGNFQAYQDALEYLCTCDGLIILISVQNKNRENKKVMGANEINTLLNNLSNRLRKKYPNRVGPLPFRAAVCFTQYDDAEFFEFGRRRALFIKGNENDLLNIPMCKMPKDRAVEPDKMRLLRDWFEDWRDGMGVFRNWFYPELINFYFISSIGFYYENDRNNPDRRIINWENCNNIEIQNLGGKQQSIIKSAPHIRPLFLLSPFAWLLSKEKMETDWFDQVLRRR